MAAPTMEERKACWGARDEFWQCLDSHGDDAAKCEKLRRAFESRCPQQWVSTVRDGRARLLQGPARAARRTLSRARPSWVCSISIFHSFWLAGRGQLLYSKYCRSAQKFLFKVQKGAASQAVQGMAFLRLASDGLCIKIPFCHAV